MKKILFGIFLSLTFVSVVFAQNNVEDEYTSQNPDLYIHDLNLVQNDFSTGGNITGTFSVTNTGVQTATAVTYQASLVSVLTDEGFIEPVGLIDYSTPVEMGTVKSGETDVQFSYKIPSSVPKDTQFALSLEISIGDVVVDTSETMVDIKGDLVDYVSFENVYLNAGEEFFYIAEGPTLSDKETLNLVMDFYSNAEITNIVPNIKIYSGNNQNGEMVDSFDSEMFDIDADNVYSVNFELPTDLDSGVYTAIFTFKKNGTTISEIIEARYLVDKDGLKTKIVSVELNNTDQNIINQFLVSVALSSAPVNHRLDENGNFIDPRAEAYYIKDVTTLSDEEIDNKKLAENSNLPQNLSLEVLIYNNKTGKLIDSKTGDNLLLFSDLGFSPLRGVEEIKVVTNLKQDGETIDTNEIISVITPKKGGFAFFDMLFSNPKFSGVLGGVLLIIILAIIVLVTKFSKGKNNFTAVAILICGAVTAGAVLFFGVDDTQKVSAGQAYNVDVDINSPLPPSVASYEPNELMRFKAEYDFIYCGNEWHTVKGQISDPVLKGRSHRGFGPVKGSGSVILSAREKKELIQDIRREDKGKPKNKQRKPVATGQGKFRRANFSDTFRAPDKPGVYWFKYKIVVANGQNTGVTREGVVTFKVEEDICKNIDGVQSRVPAGHVAVQGAGVVKNCVPQTSVPQSQLQCSASKNRLMPGESVTYTANRVDGLRANFSWFKGGSTNIAPVKTDTNIFESSYSTRYNNPGLYLITVSSVNSSGQESSCRVGVSVGQEYMDDSLEEDYIIDYLEDENFYIDEDGKRYPLDPSAANGTINFNMADGLTNTTCKADWEAQNVLKCGLYRNNILNKEIAFSGEENLDPGTYQIKCIQSNDGSEIVSEIRTCTLNPNFREN